MKATSTRPKLKVTADGKGVASHAGTRLLAEMADATGLTDALSKAMAPVCKRKRRHDPGRVLVDLAAMLADGGDCLSDLATLRDQPSLFGEVASTPTAYRVIDAIDDDRLTAIRAARAETRAVAWKAGLDPVTEHGYVTLDFDATLLTAHSEKEEAAPNYKHGFGFHPLGAGPGWTIRERPWPPSCARATPGPTRPRITSRCWTWLSPSCRSSPRRWTQSEVWPCWLGPTRPGPP